MSTPSKKKQPVKPVEQKARFVIGQKVFIIDRGRSKAGELLEGKVLSVYSEKARIAQTPSFYTIFSYDIWTAFGEYEEMNENGLYPSFQAAANKFAEPFTHLLK